MKYLKQNKNVISNLALFIGHYLFICNTHQVNSLYFPFSKAQDPLCNIPNKNQPHKSCWDNISLSIQLKYTLTLKHKKR